MKKIHKKANTLANVWLVSIIFSQATVAATTLTVDENRILIGAKNVPVGAAIYDVEFKTGTCASLFTGCQNLPFHNVDEAMKASVALMNNVFLDIAAGEFDSRPELTRGCESQGAFYYSCIALTPFQLSPTGQIVSAFWALNSAREYSDGANTYGFLFLDDESIQFPGGQMRTWAVWTPSMASPIPEPKNQYLLLFGGLLLLLKSRSLAKKL